MTLRLRHGRQEVIGREKLLRAAGGGEIDFLGYDCVDEGWKGEAYMAKETGGKWEMCRCELYVLLAAAARVRF